MKWDGMEGIKGRSGNVGGIRGKGKKWEGEGKKRRTERRKNCRSCVHLAGQKKRQKRKFHHFLIWRASVPTPRSIVTIMWHVIVYTLPR